MTINDLFAFACFCCLVVGAVLGAMYFIGFFGFVIVEHVSEYHSWLMGVINE